MLADLGIAFHEISADVKVGDHEAQPGQPSVWSTARDGYTVAMTLVGVLIVVLLVAMIVFFVRRA